MNEGTPRTASPHRIDLAEPAAMGATSRETVLFQLAAHEVGHALGLPHTDDPGSIMCCLRGAVDLRDPAIRARYVDARRRPEVRSVLGSCSSCTHGSGSGSPARDPVLRHCAARIRL